MNEVKQFIQDNYSITIVDEWDFNNTAYNQKSKYMSFMYDGVIWCCSVCKHNSKVLTYCMSNEYKPYDVDYTDKLNEFKNIIKKNLGGEMDANSKRN